MAASERVSAFFSALLTFFVEVTLFWWRALYRRIVSPTRRQLLFETLNHAQNYEEWIAAAAGVDFELGNFSWREASASKAYDYQLIHRRLQTFEKALENEDVYTLIQTMRSGLVRNLGNITAPKLYNRAYEGTKGLIEAYVEVCVKGIEFVATYPVYPETDFTSQEKLDLLHDSRQAFGRTCLVLQGGSIFGLCHLGVVKALYLRGLLPRIIAGTATGALMAALVAVHTDDELLDFLSGDGIDISAFTTPSDRAKEDSHKGRSGLSILWRRFNRFLKSGYVLDPERLAECVQANVGNATFEESYNRTKRVLNITVSSAGAGAPTLLNYLTAPNVLIWSAALASNHMDARNPQPPILCKDAHGEIEEWDLPVKTTMKPRKPAYKKVPSTDHDRHTPLSRVGELFNVNHFLISQARPYIIPFLAPSTHHSRSPRSSREPWRTYFMRLIMLELQHRLTQMDMLGLLSPGIRRLLLDESVPGSSWTLVPEVKASDFVRLLRNPRRADVDYWIGRGERSVWPAVCAITTRVGIEVGIDRCYQLIRRRKPYDQDLMPEMGREGVIEELREQRRASMGGE